MDSLIPDGLTAAVAAEDMSPNMVKGSSEGHTQNQNSIRSEPLFSQDPTGSRVKQKKLSLGRGSFSPRNESSALNSRSFSSLKRKKGQDADDVQDPTLRSISKSARLPEKAASARGRAFKRIANPKLRAHLNFLNENAANSHKLRSDYNELLMTGAEAGEIEVEGEMERTWRVSQDEIVASVGIDAGTQRKEWNLDGGPYVVRYTRNGR